MTDPAAPRGTGAPRERILVRAPNWVGDVVLSLPALRDVRRRFPTARLEVFARPWVAELYRATFEGQASPIHVARDGWMDGLAAGDLAAIERAAAVFEGHDYRVSAADAWADAALMAERAAMASPAVQKAMDLRRAIGLQPLLGATP